MKRKKKKKTTHTSTHTPSTERHIVSVDFQKQLMQKQQMKN